MINQEDIQNIKNVLLSSDDVLIICHLRPDGDTLGSGFALMNALKHFGINTAVACEHPITPKYQYLCNGEDVQKIPFEPKLVVTVDVATTDLLGDMFSKYKEKIDIVIDHHPSNKNFGKINLITPECAATGEIMYELICAMGLQDDKVIACALYTAISTDTGCFKFSNTTANTHRITANLIDTGFDFSDINKRLFRTKSQAQFTIETASQNNMKFYFDGKLAIMSITMEMMQTAEATEDDVDGISTLPREVDGVEMGITMREVEPNVYKVSVRNNGLVDCSKFCSIFDGGGHKAAAGCTIKGDLYTVMGELIVEAGKFLEDISY